MWEVIKTVAKEAGKALAIGSAAIGAAKLGGKLASEAKDAYDKARSGY